MRALVTGASGFIGHALAGRLLRDGWGLRVLARDPRERGPPEERSRAVNAAAVGWVIRAARRHGARRVVHTSTVGIHGCAGGTPVTEASPVRPDGIYEVTKAAGDAIALAEAGEGRPEVVVLRPAPVYGPGDTRLVKLF